MARKSILYIIFRIGTDSYGQQRSTNSKEFVYIPFIFCLLTVVDRRSKNSIYFSLF